MKGKEKEKEKEQKQKQKQTVLCSMNIAQYVDADTIR